MLEWNNKMNTLSPPVKPDFTQSPTEQELREDLAAAYRLLAMTGLFRRNEPEPSQADQAMEAV